jgi:hypothetical protein
VAEQVAKVNPALVDRDDKGEIYTVRYDAVNAMLLNEFLKEHRKGGEIGSDSRGAAEGNQSSHCESERAGIANPEGEREG